MKVSPRHALSRFRMLLVLLLITIAGLATTPLSADDEAGLKQLWDRHQSSPDDHAALIEACRAFAKTNAGDPLLPVAQGIEAWHLFRSDAQDAAANLLRSHLASVQSGGGSAISTGAAVIARGWLSRLDRERVVQSLKAYYRQEVCFPPSLSAIAAHPKIPETLHPLPADRYGKPWEYRLVEIEGLSGIEDQRYALRSAILGETSELLPAIEAGYASGIEITPTAVRAGGDSPQVVFREAATGAEKTIALGKQVEGIFLAYVGEKIILVCNHSYWKIFVLP